MSSLRSEAIRCYKILQRTKNKVFAGDDHALKAAKQKIKEEFLKNKSVSDTTKIADLIQFGYSVENELRTTVIQAKEIRDGVYRLKITPDTVKLENFPFDEYAIIDDDPKNNKPCKCK